MIVDVISLPLDAGYFLIFINDSFHSLQTVNFLETIAFFYAFFKVFYAEMKPPLDQVYYSPLARQYCLQGPIDLMGIMSNFRVSPKMAEE